MKKVKKILAVLLAFALVLGMSMTTMAENAKPQATDNADITVLGIETDATVKAYKIVQADYNEYGFLGYSKVDDSDDFTIYAPTADQITTLAAKYRGDDSGVKLNEVKVNDQVQYTLNDQTAGMYLILVEGSPSAKIYNPMIVSLAYKTLTQDSSSSGVDNELQDGEVDATSRWQIGDVTAYVKSSPIDIQKEANVETQEIGGTVSYTITTKVPDYSTEYTKTEDADGNLVGVKFEVKDTFTGLELIVSEDETVKPTISVQKKVLEEGKSEPTYETIDNTDEKAYTIIGNEKGSITFTISFKSDWLMQNPATDLVIKYDAKMTGDATNDSDHDNKAELTYTRNPGDDTGYDYDIEKVYTFDIDGVGMISKDIIKKVEKIEGVDEPLAGAEFKLFTDPACTTQYTNTVHTATSVIKSDREGRLAIKGLNAETAYYLKETKAPLGYSLNDTVYKIYIDNVVVENEELVSWDVLVTPVTKVTTDQGTSYVEGTTVTNEIKFSQNVEVLDTTVEDATVTTTNIMNTKIIALPSTGGIGTTIFTVAGCAIMIAAAFLFFASRRKEEE